MATDFTKQPTPAEAAEIAACRDPRALYELVQSKIAKWATAAESNPQSVQERPTPPPEPTNSELPTHQRVIYPYKNVRTILQGYSESELDEQEKRIREMYQNQ